MKREGILVMLLAHRVRRSLAMLLLVAGSCAGLFAQKPSASPSATPAKKETSSPTPTATPERPREIVALLHDARFAAPELTVDTILKLLEKKKISEAMWRRELLDEAIRLNDDVQHSMPMRPAYGGRVERNNPLNDTEVFVLAGAHGAKLDRLSFRGRVITLLLDSDKERAKQMIFQMGGRLGLKPRTCEDALTYGPDDIYTIVANVAKTVFTPQQVAEGHRALFLVPWLENIESPRQIYPALNLLQQVQGPEDERQMLYYAAAKAINRDFRDDRSFTYAWDGITARVGKLISGETDVYKSELGRAYRDMLVKNLRGSRCKDNEMKKDGPLPDYVEAANKIIHKPLVIEDVVASEYSGTAKLTHILKKSPTALKLRDELIKVRDTQIVDNKIVNHDVTDLAWASQVTEFIERVASFEGDDLTEGELLFLKNGLIGGMISGVEPGQLRTGLVRKYVRLLAGSSLQKSNFIAWLRWIHEVERMAPEVFYEIVSEFPNPNFKVLVEVKKNGL